jgi:hypothetical protein
LPRSFVPLLASTGPIFAVLLPPHDHSLLGASSKVSLHGIASISLISEMMALTQSSLFNLLYREGDNRRQFGGNLYDDLGYRRSRWNLGIDVESPED